MLSPDSSYRLLNTGQGLNRVQAAPRVSNAMAEILSRVKHQVGRSWVGLSVVHLGDRDVPNALFFIDKYTQVPRILAPLSRTVHALHDMAYNERTWFFVRFFFDKKNKKAFEKEREAGDMTPERLNEWRDIAVRDARLRVLRSYFRSGFDGSGSDGG